MAKKRTAGRTPAAKPARTPKATSKKPAATTEVEVIEEAAGEGIDTGIVVMTSVILVTAILFVDKLRGIFDTGVFF